MEPKRAWDAMKSIFINYLDHMTEDRIIMWAEYNLGEYFDEEVMPYHYDFLEDNSDTS